ncbi:uncharacterized protein LOC124645543 [Helicoverpa zea]|uniref:uncharacterized protein LOC124645543 n=1 Tax=Helicoverpa zea TaxID=7113 RepID=UPI001F563A91|nr:uncharacterized protein LOC124645543 [Helicoverpa zea]
MITYLYFQNNLKLVMNSRRSSFFRNFVDKNQEPKLNVVRRIFSEDESDDDLDFERDNYVTKLRHPLREEYDTLGLQQKKTGAVEELGKSFDPGIHLPQATSQAADDHQEASISQMSENIQEETTLNQVIHELQSEDNGQVEKYLDHDTHPSHASISQTGDYVQAETFIYQVLNQLQTEVNVQEERPFVQDIHPTQASISQTGVSIQTETFQVIHQSQKSILQTEDYVQEEKNDDQDAYGVHRSPSPKYDLQSNASFESKSSELSLKKPYKKRILYERFKEVEDCIQEIRDEDVLTNNLIERTIVIDIEPEDNADQSGEVENVLKNRKNLKRNRIYKHIDFLSDSEEFIYSSSSWKDSSESIDSALHSNENNVKKQRKTSKTKKKKIKDNNFDDTKENSEPKKKERKINKNKLRTHLKNSGKQYTSISGKVIAEKKMKSNPCVLANCHNECYNISSDKRQAIFNHYWSLNNERRRDWLVSNSKVTAIKRKRAIVDQSRRQCTFDYFINEGEGKRKVCLKFLLNTLDIKQKYLYNIITEATHGSSKEDSRGKHIPSNKTAEKNLEETRNYIKNLPYLPSHYCRKNSKRFYLPQEFRSLANLYKIYKETMIREDKQIVGERVFQNIFREFNIGFHIPRKDKCAKCVRLEKDNGQREEEKLAHLKDKEETYERFQAHQKIQDENILCVSFDLQKVLNTPYGQSMLLYYSRKLAVYNLTFYESRTREGYCYSWTETEGKRGANEVCTILEKYIKMVDDRGSVRHLLLYSDACPGQNKNKIVLACIHICLQNCKNIASIQMNYLLPGHSYMPVDSMHSVIEKSVTNTIIWAPSQWATVFTLARKNPKPYHVEILTHKDFYGWDVVGDKYFKGNLTGKISKVRTATFKKSEAQKIAIKYTMATDGPVEEIEITNKNKNIQLKNIYKTRLPISKKKYQDLWKLCTSKIIPEMYHYEYENFPSAVNVQDTLQDTDVEDNT